MTRSKIMAVALVVAVVSASCGSDDSSGSTNDTKAPSSLSIYTPAALDEIVSELADDYGSKHSEIKIRVLKQDKAALAGTVTKARPGVAVLVKQWLPAGPQATKARPFGRNLAVIAVPTGNPGRITDATAFDPAEDLRTAVCDSSGLLHLRLAKSGFKPDPSIIKAGCEVDSLKKVASGKLDAALMFRAGLDLPDGVELIDIPKAKNIVIDLSYVVLGSSRGAIAFGKYLASDPAKRILTRRGYLP